MTKIPSNVVDRCESYCSRHSTELKSLRGYGVDDYVWQTIGSDILKVYRHSPSCKRELAVYQRLDERSLYRIQGFAIPVILDFDEELLAIEMTNVRPPYILDFGAATLGRPPEGFDPESEEWNAEQSRKFGRDWPEVKRLLDALLQYGIHYPVVHTQNIRVRA